MSAASDPVLELRAAACAAAAPGLSLSFARGTFTVLTGEPGSGRAALLRLLGLLDAPATGEVLLEGRPTAALREPERDELRSQRCGFLFTAPFLLATFTVVENVAMPLFKISHVNPEEARVRTDRLLDFVGLTSVAQDPAGTLAPFEQHAVSLARALANDPAIITVESLETSLSPDEAARFTGLLQRTCGHFGVTVIATAPTDFAAATADRVIELANGAVVRDSLLTSEPLG